MKNLNQIAGCISVVFLLFIGVSCGDTTDNITSNSPDQAFNEDIFITTADDSNIDEETKALYREDAEKLAIRFVNNDSPQQTQIPSSLIQSFYNGMIHIFNFDHPRARQATREFPVHARTPSSSREIIVSADTALPCRRAHLTRRIYL